MKFMTAILLLAVLAAVGKCSLAKKYWGDEKQHKIFLS